MAAEELFGRGEVRRFRRLVDFIEPTASADAKLAAVSRLMAANAIASVLRSEKGDSVGELLGWAANDLREVGERLEEIADKDF
ncbi:MAG: hypothetical protein ACTHOU_22390 [Aureliella sp.]